MKKGLLGTALILSSVVSITANAKVEKIPNLFKQAKQLNQTEANFIFNRNVKGTIQGSTSIFGGEPANWFNLDPLVDQVEGTSAEEVYKAFGAPQSKDIIVAVIDSGVDVNHEDLQDKIWMNEAELNGTEGVDDDQNGYVDDVFGWNFIGGSDGMGKVLKDQTLGNGHRLIKGKVSAQVGADTLEVTRELVRLKTLKAELAQIGETLSSEEVALLDQTQKEVDSELVNAKPAYDSFFKGLNSFKAAVEVLKSSGLKEVSVDAIQALSVSSKEEVAAKKLLLSDLNRGRDQHWYQVRVDYFGDTVLYYYNEDYANKTRSNIVGDDYSNQLEKSYGNNDVIGPDSSHGTHVAGIIGANRNNDLGIKGVAENVKIMAIRVVPNGDERDKDVANGIYYAVDNGAKVINMSFGKSYSPYKKIVDEAMAYAAAKGVLLVHAAGNSHQDNNVTANFPNKRMFKYSLNDCKTGATEILKCQPVPILQNTRDSYKRDFNSTWLEIGASAYKKGTELPAIFSNYGDRSVDVFSPGVELLSTTPDNSYDSYSGTSMASPAAAGVAALTLSYNPDLSGEELKSVLLQTSKKYPLLYVRKPSERGSAPVSILFSDLSINGGIVDALEAVKAATAGL